MVARRMLIDTAHMSEHAFKDYYDYLTEKFPGYPLYSSHARLKRLMDDEDKDILEEFVVTDEQIEMYKAIGGMVGLRTGFEHICDAPDRSRPGQTSINCKGKPAVADPKPAVANSCPGSSRSIAQMVDYADQKGLAIAIGSDLNGNTYQPSPRFGLEACYANRVLNKGYVDKQGDPPKSVRPAYNERGLAHIGLLPDLVADLRALETPGSARIDNSAEMFIQMWERAYDVKVADITNETACKEDRDCGVEGWYCSTGFTGLEPNKCKAKLEDGQRCINERQCRSGACDASICFTPASVGMDGKCLVNAQCRTGRCSSLDGITAGKCVCMEDSDCAAGEYCNVGVEVGVADIGKNACKAKLANGALCTKDHQCSAGRCKTGFCSAESSVSMGGECRFDDECRAGKCSSPVGGATKGKCVCTEDGHCGTGRYCYEGVEIGIADIGKNVCKDKLSKGKACTKGHQCRSNECKLFTCR
jgi:microsomal dipeptidase-like Zn-dependent dipeptidase